MSCGDRYVIASKAVAAGAPVRHVLSAPPKGGDTGFLLLEHMDGHDDDEFTVLCFDCCALDLVPGNALEVARSEGEWHADDVEVQVPAPSA